METKQLCHIRIAESQKRIPRREIRLQRDCVLPPRRSEGRMSRRTGGRVGLRLAGARAIVRWKQITFFIEIKFSGWFFASLTTLKHMYFGLPLMWYALRNILFRVPCARHSVQTSLFIPSFSSFAWANWERGSYKIPIDRGTWLLI